ncbi:MAG: hypothetical protein AB1635_02490 [Acidobacteriota bacterium]
MRAALIVIAAGFWAAQPTFAQAPGGAMPDAGQMSGIPLGAPELPDGAVSVRLVRERMGNNIPNHAVALKGARIERTETTDAQGRAQFSGLPIGTVVYAEAEIDGETLRSQEFDVPAKGGVRVALVAGAAAAAARDQAARAAAASEPARAGVVTLGGETRIIMEFQDDELSVFYLLDVVNAARTPIDTGGPIVIDLPTGARNVGTMQGSSPLASVSGPRILINGPFPPGTTPVQVGFRLPWRGTELEVRQTWPVAMERLFVAVQKLGSLHMESPQFEAHSDAEAGGTPFIMGTGGRLNPGDTMVVRITGMPARTTLIRDTGLALAALILLAGAWFAFTGRPAATRHDATLAARREKLYGELVDLEQQLRAGRIDEARYLAKRQGVVAQLERVLSELDRSPAGGGESVAA